MEPLHSFRDTLTYDTYRKMNLSHTLTSRNTVMLPLMILAVGVAVMYFTKSIPYGLLVMALYVMILVLKFNSNVKKSWGKAGKNQLETTYTFFQDHYEVKNDAAFNSVKYKELMKIGETKELFLLYVSNNQMHVVVKGKCSPELIEFLSNKK